MEPKEWMQNKNLVLKNEKMELLKKQAMQEEQTLLESMSLNEQFDYLISKLNYCRRKSSVSCFDFNVMIRKGDICYIDYGNSYVNEIGYLHFGLILAIKHGKAFIVPITGSDSKTVLNDSSDHLLQLGKIKGMRKLCACYINDAKWVNTSRIIDVKSHIAVFSNQFQEIKKRVKESIDN